MKLREILETAFKGEAYYDKTLQYEILTGILPFLKECDEFKECDELVILKSPILETHDGQVVRCPVRKIANNTKFLKRAYLYSLSLGPEMFDYKTMYDMVKNNACITPITYDVTTFVPKRKIVIEIPVTEQFSVFNSDNISEKTKIIDLISDIFDNPDDYKVKGECDVLIRGLFESMSIEDELVDADVDNLNFDQDTYKNFEILYLKEHIDGADMSLSVEHKDIPIDYMNSFKKAFGGKPLHKFNEIEVFLKNLDNK